MSSAKADFLIIKKKENTMAEPTTKRRELRNSSILESNVELYFLAPNKIQLKNMPHVDSINSRNVKTVFGVKYQYGQISWTWFKIG